MNSIQNKKIGIMLLIVTFPLFAEISLQENIYDAADEMVQFDEKMNRAMAEHNSMDFIEEYSSIDVNEDTLFDPFVSSNDFKETKNDYTFIQEVFDPNKTKVDVEIKNNFLILLFSTTKHEPPEFGNVRILDSSTISLSLPPDANQEEMKKTYQNGILKIVFPKK